MSKTWLDEDWTTPIPELERSDNPFNPDVCYHPLPWLRMCHWVSEPGENSYILAYCTHCGIEIHVTGTNEVQPVNFEHMPWCMVGKDNPFAYGPLDR